MYRLYNLCCRVHYISMAVPRVASIHIQRFQNKLSQKKLNRLEAFAAHRTQVFRNQFLSQIGRRQKERVRNRLSPDGLTLHFLTGQDRAPRLRKVILNLNMYIVYGRQWTGRMIQELCDKASYQEERTSIQLEQALVCSSALLELWEAQSLGGSLRTKSPCSSAWVCAFPPPNMLSGIQQCSVIYIFLK